MKTSSFDRSLDYESHWSDGVRLEIGIGNTSAKLTFYQKFPSINKKCEISKVNNHKQLQFEVNLPQETLLRLSYVALGRLKAKKNALKMKANKNDEHIERAWFEFDEALGIVYDTDDVELKQVDLENILNSLSNLAARINTPLKDKK